MIRIRVSWLSIRPPPHFGKYHILNSTIQPFGTFNYSCEVAPSTAATRMHVDQKGIKIVKKQGLGFLKSGVPVVVGNSENEN